MPVFEKTPQAMDPLPPPVASPVSRQPKKHFLILSAILVICLLGIGYGSFMLYRAFTGPGDSTADSGNVGGMSAKEEEARRAYEERVRNISLENVYQFVLENDKIGPIVVIQGEAVNRFAAPKEFIIVEARLFDEKRNVLAARQQMGGVSLTVFQLQMLSEKEMQEALDNRIIILTYNTNVPPGGRVPFFVVFPKVPPAMQSFEVRVVDVRDAQAEEAAPGR